MQLDFLPYLRRHNQYRMILIGRRMHLSSCVGGICDFLSNRHRENCPFLEKVVKRPSQWLIDIRVPRTRKWTCPHIWSWGSDGRSDVTKLTLETRTFYKKTPDKDKENPGQGERFLKSVAFLRTESDVILSGKPWPIRLWTVMLSMRDFFKLNWFLNLTLNLAHFQCVGCVWTNVRRCFSGR